MERITIETTKEIKDALKTLAFNKQKTMKDLLNEMINKMVTKG